jgi:hypothetical protein
MSNKRKIYYACLSIFTLGIVLRIALNRYWHSVSPHLSQPSTGHTYALDGRGGTVFVTTIEGYFLGSLYVLPYAFLLVGMLVWASAWREWK